MTKIYVIQKYSDAIHFKDIAYATSKEKVNDFLSLMADGKTADEEYFKENRKHYNKELSPKIFKDHLPNIMYHGSKGTFSYRIENTI